MDSFETLTIKQIKAAVRLVRNTDFSEFTLEQMHDFFFQHFGSFAFPSLEIEKKSIEKFAIYRARDHKTVNDENDPREYSYPYDPLKFCTNVGRANWIGKAVFYGSTVTHTALSEIKEIYRGKEFYIAKWKFNLDNLDNEFLRTTPMFMGVPDPQGLWSKLSQQPDFEQRLIASLGKTKAKRTIFLLKELCRLFAHPDDSLYKFTAFVADQIIYSSLNKPDELFFPLLLYPSLASKGSAMNFAIHPLFVDQFLKLERVFHIVTHDYGDSHITSGIFKIGHVINGKIVWKRLEELVLDREFIIDEVSCKCGVKMEGTFEEKLLFKGSKVEVNELIGVLCNDVESELASDEVRTKMFDEMSVPGRVEYRYWRNLPDDFSFLDQDGDEHKNLTIRGEKSLKYNLIDLDVKK